MSGYEVEHNIPKDQQQAEQPRRRPDLGTFFSRLDLVDNSNAQNANSLPLPQDVSAAFRTLANAFDIMRNNATGAPPVGDVRDGQEELLQRLVESLMDSADHPPTEVQGVSDEFIEQLERVPKKNLRKDQSCPICANPFLDDSHPLVVRLPCHKDHLFDLECIQPWLKLNPTCPMDRQQLMKKKEPIKTVEDDEPEYDDMYA